MTMSVDCLTMEMLAEIRLSRELPGLTPLLSPARDAVWHGFAAPERHELVNRLTPQKIARRWWTMFNALAIVTDRVAGTGYEDLYFKDFAGRKTAREIADYCQNALENMLPGGEHQVMCRASHLAGLQDFQDPQILRVDLKRLRQALRDAANPDLRKGVDAWIKLYQDACSQLAENPGHHEKEFSLSRDGRSIAISGRDGPPSLAQFIAFNPITGAELTQLPTHLPEPAVSMRLLHPDEGAGYWGLFGLFEPLMSYDEHEIVVAKSNIAKMTFQILQDAFATSVYRGPRPGFQVGQL
jgi:hypothetical protein